MILVFVVIIYQQNLTHLMLSVVISQGSSTVLMWRDYLQITTSLSSLNSIFLNMYTVQEAELLKVWNLKSLQDS